MKSLLALIVLAGIAITASAGDPIELLHRAYGL